MLLTLVAVGAALLAVFVLALWGLGCEDAPREELDTVGCDPRTSFLSWLVAIILIGAPLAVLGGGVASVVTRRPRWLAIASIATIPALAVVPSINSTELPDEEVPRFESLRVDEPVCYERPQAQRCGEGIPVSFTLSDRAWIDFLVTWQRPEKPGPPPDRLPDKAPPPLDPLSGQARVLTLGADGRALEPLEEFAGDLFELEGGSHTIRLAPARGGNAGFPPGAYTIEIDLTVPHETNQENAHRNEELHFTALRG